MEDMRRNLMYFRLVFSWYKSPSDCVDSSSVIVPEVKRHEDHLQQIKGHLLQDLAHCCLQDDTITRPSARETCHTLQQLTIQCSC